MEENPESPVPASPSPSPTASGTAPVGKAAKPLTIQSMRAEIARWGIGLIIVGAISVLPTGVLDPYWGGGLIALGVVSLFVRRRGMFIPFGVLLILAALINGLFSIPDGHYEWTAFGAFQVLCAISVFRRFLQYAAVVAAPSSPGPTPLPEGEAVPPPPAIASARPHSRLGIASAILALTTLLLLVVLVIVLVTDGANSVEGSLPPHRAALLGAFAIAGLTGLGLGIGGSLQKSRRRIWAITGAIVTGVLIGLLVLGLLFPPPPS